MAKNISLDPSLYYAHIKAILNINCTQRNNCFEMIRNVKLKNVIKVITSNWNTVCQ